MARRSVQRGLLGAPKVILAVDDPSAGPPGSHGAVPKPGVGPKGGTSRETSLQATPTPPASSALDVLLEAIAGALVSRDLRAIRSELNARCGSDGRAERPPPGSPAPVAAVPPVSGPGSR